jgi:phosphoglycerate dehydrogenase-like enzyme
MTVRGYTRASRGCPHVDAYFHGAQLADFAQGLDYLVCVLPNTAATRGLVDADLLARLPAHALLINAGRGSAVDEAALCNALRAGQLAGAVLDVFQQEPLPPEHPFWSTPNLLITSHTAGPSFPEEIARVFIENYQHYLAGEALKYRVDFTLGY